MYRQRMQVRSVHCNRETNYKYDQYTERCLAGEVGDIGIYISLAAKGYSVFTVVVVDFTPHHIYLGILID